MVDSIRVTTRLSLAFCLAAMLAPASARGQSVPLMRAVQQPLQVTVSGPKEAHVGQQVTFQVEVRNAGKEISAPANVDFCLSYFESIPLSIKALAPHECQTLTVRFTGNRSGTVNVGLMTEGERDHAPAGVLFRSFCGNQVKFEYDPKTPARELLPEPPQFAAAKAGLPAQLAEVAEVCLERTMDKSKNGAEAREHVAATIDRINYLNGKKNDGFVRDLISERTDLAGLPFVLGDACRMNKDRRPFFNWATQSIRTARRQGSLSVSSFRLHYQTANGSFAINSSANVAALMQVLTPEPASVQEGLVEYLEGIANADASRADASRALAKLAIFSDDAGVRRAAVTALGKRPAKDANDYAQILAQGLEYPWPAVMQRAGDAIAKLKLKELIPWLVNELERPDPRAPKQRAIDGKSVTTVRELVRINHHRNCVLCHAPAVNLAGRAPQETPLTAQVLLPNEPFPVEYYDSPTPDILVRFDVTYLRQDFSMMMPVENAHPWPSLQRFDFLVRTRQVSRQEAKDIESLLQARNPDDRFPNRRAALQALRELTGLDAEPTAEAWRKVLAKS